MLNTHLLMTILIPKKNKGSWKKTCLSIHLEENIKGDKAKWTVKDGVVCKDKQRANQALPCLPCQANIITHYY